METHAKTHQDLQAPRHQEVLCLRRNGFPVSVGEYLTPHHSFHMTSLPISLPLSKELVSYYQANSLGTSFPGVDTTLQVPYKEVDLRTRGGGSNPPAPPPLPPSRSNPPLPSPLPQQEKELWAEVLFNFSADYPDEMSIEVSISSLNPDLSPLLCTPLPQKHEHVQVLEKQTDKPGWWYGQCSDRVSSHSMSLV